MVRRGSIKRIHATGHAAQLYSVQDDPREEHNLSGQAGFAKEAAPYAALLAQFDPEAVEREVQASLARGRVLKEAMLKAGLPRWDHQSFFDASERYWRKG